jgi:hypothetical protein
MQGGKTTRDFKRDVLNLIVEKSGKYYEALLKDGYAIVGDNYIAIELKKQLNINKIEYFVLTHLSVEYLIVNLNGSYKLEKMLKSMYAETERTKIISMQLVPIIEYFKNKGMEKINF